MSAEYEMIVTALRTLPEKGQKLAMVKGQLLEEETNRMTERGVTKPKLNTDTVTAFNSHKNYKQSKWKEQEVTSPFPFSCHNCWIRGHKRSNCRKPVQYSGNYH
jgi:hypothetical protein